MLWNEIGRYYSSTAKLHCRFQYVEAFDISLEITANQTAEQNGW